MNQKSKYEFPLHRFNKPAAQAWSAGGAIAKRAMARALNTLYPNRTVGVVFPQPLHLVAVVSASGSVQELNRPYRTVKFWDIENKPEVGECQCSHFTDPENSHLPWKQREAGVHHPLCQYDPAALHAYAALGKMGFEVRPDQWTKVNDAFRDKLGLPQQHSKIQVASS